MRTWYVCLACAAHYLPPESMTYPRLNLEASPVHCSTPECRDAVTPILEGIRVPADMLALWARRAAGMVGEEPRRPRPGRRARGRRSASGPAAARSRLL